MAALLYSIGYVRFTTDDGSLASLGVQFVTPTPGPTAEPSPPTPEPTPTFTPTPTQVPGRPDLYQLAAAPEHMSYLLWYWREGFTFKGLVVDFTVHNDIDLAGDNGLYLMLGSAEISGVSFYFGLQTNVYSPEPPHWRGKGLLFSRWDTRDLSHARWHEQDGWSQSSGHEGDFIGVRREYRWGTGDYSIRLGPDEADEDGVWFGLWITDKADGDETWVGSLRFPLKRGRALMSSPSYSTIEVYGAPMADRHTGVACEHRAATG